MTKSVKLLFLTANNVSAVNIFCLAKIKASLSMEPYCVIVLSVGEAITSWSKLIILESYFNFRVKNRQSYYKTLVSY